jgi:hypothetical protein
MQRSAAVKLAEFENRYGETKTIVTRRGRRTMAVQRDRVTVTSALGKVVSQEIGKRVKVARAAARLSMDDLATKAGLLGGKQRIHAIETALDGGIRLGTLYALGKALGVDPLSLLPPASEVFAAAPVAVSTEPHLVVETRNP